MGGVYLGSGPLIREWLEHRRPPTAAEIATAGGFTRQFAWRVLQGRERPSRRFLEACESLGVPVAEILGVEHSGEVPGMLDYKRLFAEEALAGVTAKSPRRRLLGWRPS